MDSMDGASLALVLSFLMESGDNPFRHGRPGMEDHRGPVETRIPGRRAFKVAMLSRRIHDQVREALPIEGQLTKDRRRRERNFRIGYLLRLPAAGESYSPIPERPAPWPTAIRGRQRG